MTSISWRWDICGQSLLLSKPACNKILETILDERNCCRRAMGIPLAIAVAGTILALAVSQIAEPIIKGLGNIFGACFSDNCSLLRGLGFIFLGTPAACLCVLIITPIILAIELLVIPFWAAIDPDKCRV